MQIEPASKRRLVDPTARVAPTAGISSAGIMRILTGLSVACLIAMASVCACELADIRGTMAYGNRIVGQGDVLGRYLSRM